MADHASSMGEESELVVLTEVTEHGSGRARVSDPGSQVPSGTCWSWQLSPCHVFDISHTEGMEVLFVWGRALRYARWRCCGFKFFTCSY